MLYVNITYICILTYNTHTHEVINVKKKRQSLFSNTNFSNWDVFKCRAFRGIYVDNYISDWSNFLSVYISKKRYWLLISKCDYETFSSLLRCLREQSDTICTRVFKHTTDAITVQRKFKQLVTEIDAKFSRRQYRCIIKISFGFTALISFADEPPEARKNDSTTHTKLRK